MMAAETDPTIIAYDAGITEGRAEILAKIRSEAMILLAEGAAPPDIANLLCEIADRIEHGQQ